MKIAFILPSLKKSGPINLAMELVSELKKSHNVDIFYFDKKRNSYDEEKTYQISFFTKIKDRYDVYHSHGLRPDLYVAFHLLNKRGTTVSTMHNIIPEELSYIYPKTTVFFASRAWKFCLKRFHHIIAISPYMKNWYQNWGLKNTTYIPNTRKIVDTKKELSIEKRIVEFNRDKLLIMTIGQVIPRKNLQHMIELLRCREDLKWVHLGSGSLMEDLHQIVVQRGLQEKVIFLGQIPEAHQYISLADVFALCSSSEGFPLVILEALLQKKPIICNDLPHYQGLFVDGEILFCDTSNPIEFSEQIDKALQHSKTLCSNALSTYHHKYAPEIVCQKYVNIYQRKI